MAYSGNKRNTNKWTDKQCFILVLILRGFSLSCQAVAPERIWREEYTSSAKRRKNCFVMALHFLALGVQLVVLVIAFVMVRTVWSVSYLLFLYSRYPHAQPFVKGEAPPVPYWARRHCYQGGNATHKRLTKASYSAIHCAPHLLENIMPAAWSMDIGWNSALDVAWPIRSQCDPIGLHNINRWLVDPTPLYI